MNTQLPVDNRQLNTWLAAAGQGDAVAFRHLATALGPKLHALAWRLLGGLSGAGSNAAEDVVQEVLIKLWQTAPRWQADGNVGGHAEGGRSGNVTAYASRLVYTTTIDYFRRQHPNVSLDAKIETSGGDTAPAWEIPVPETVTGQIEQRQTRNWLLKGLKELPERQQQAVLLSYFHEQKQADVAAALHTSEKAVESLLVRARRNLFDLLAPPGNDSATPPKNTLAAAML